MPQASVTLKRRIDAATYNRVAQSKQEDFIVFLAGPYIDPEQALPAGSSHATLLRYELFHRLQKAGHIVSLGEYKEVIDAYKQELGDYHNAAVAEVGHAKDTAHAVVIIVDSPGSFAEIGAFAMKKEICEKMMVISDQAHKNSIGYVRTGPIDLSKSFGAIVEFINLPDIDPTEALVTKFIERLVQRRRALRIL